MRLVSPDEREFTALFGPEIRNVWVCSPWITSAGVDLLLKSLRNSNPADLTQIELWVRLNAQDRLAGLTDYFAIDQLLSWIKREGRQTTVIIRTAEELHAKAV